MKNYKVGDTVYVKGKITDVDHNETMLPYCVVSSPNYHFWASQESVLDELPTAEPVKSVLPKDVADELEDAKKSAYNFFGFLRDCNNKTYPETCHFMFYDTVSSDTQIKILSDAWYNGYTVEKEPVYNLILGFDPDESDRRLCNALYKNHGELSIDAATDTYDLRGDDDYQFTQEEIDKYNKSFWIKNIDLNDYKVEVVADDSKDC